MIHTGLSKPWILDKDVAIYRKLYYISCVEKRGYFIIILVYAEHLISKYFVIEPFKTPGICKPLKLSTCGKLQVEQVCDYFFQKIRS